MTFAQISLAIAKPSDALTIALMSRDLIETGLAWSWTPRRVMASLGNPQANVITARTAAASDRIVGFGIMRYGDDEAHLDLLAVHPRWRRQGIGRRIVEWLEKPARAGGIAAVVLEVRSANRGAQLFYERLGYRRIAEIRGYYQGCESAVRMCRDLSVLPRRHRHHGAS